METGSLRAMTDSAFWTTWCATLWKTVPTGKTKTTVEPEVVSQSNQNVSIKYDLRLSA